MWTRSISAAVFVFGVVFARRAGADGPATSDHEAAVTEFSAGRARFEAGDCKGAIPRFVASLKREQSVGARFNLAECSAREGRTAQAWNHYKAAEQLAIRKGDSQRVDLAHGAAANLDRRVTKIRLVLPSEGAVTLKIDGVVVDVTDHWLLTTGYALEPGTRHTLAAEMAGKPPWMRADVRGDPGVELPAMVVDFGRPKETALTLEPRPKTPALRTVSYVVGGVGVAALATSGVFALLASSAKSEAESACASGPGFTYPSSCDPATRNKVDPANDRAQTNASVATVAVIGGAVLVSAAVALFVVSRSKSTSGIGPALNSVAASGSSGAGGLLSGSF